MKKAIVLSGGGSKGAYQVGVWRAIKKLGLKYDIVTGTSVGALNAALMVQKDYLRALWLWYNMDFKLIFDDEFNDNIKDTYKKYTKSVLDGGMNISKLEDTVNKILNIKKIYKSHIDMGIVTVKIPSLKSVELTKKDIKPNQLKDYLIASASCFPAFQKKIIDDEMYIDGGLYDNLPINLAIKMGATSVIAVDLEEIGIKKRVKDKNVDITYIRPRNDMGSFLIFNKNTARRCIRLGYNDTLKTYDKLDGNIYSFKKNNLHNNYTKYHDLYIANIKKLLKYKDNDILNNLVKITVFKNIFNNKNKESDFNKQIEQLGRIFDIDDSFIYDINKFNNNLIDHCNQLIKNDDIEQNIKDNKFKIWFKNKYTVKYILEFILEQKRCNYKKMLHLALLFPNEFLKAVYLKIIINK